MRRARPAGTFFAAVVALTGLTLTPARGETLPDGPRVVVQSADDVAGDEPAAALPPELIRLVAELTLLGLRVQVEPTSSTPAAAPLASSDDRREPARVAVPSARILLDTAHGRVDVTFLDVVTGEVTLRQQLEASPAADTTTVLLVRTVELVRAVLLPPPSPPPRPSAGPGDVLGAPATQPAPPPAAPLATRLDLALTSGVVLTPGGAGGDVTLALSGHARVAGPARVELLAFAPLTRHEYTTVEGRSEATTWLFGAGLSARRAWRRAAADAALGGLGLWLRTSGTPAPGYAVTTTSAVGIAAYGRVGLSLGLGPQIAARVDLLAGPVLRRPLLSLPDSGDRAVWGHGFGAALAGVEARWF